MPEETVSLPVDLDVPFSPIPVRAGGQIHLVYELFVHNSFPHSIELNRLEVISGELEGQNSQSVNIAEPARNIPSYISYSGKELAENTIYLHENLRKTRRQAFESSTLACIYIWFSIERGRLIPQKLRHRIYFKAILNDSSHREEVMEGAATAVLPVATPILSPPLQGQNWLAVHGPSNTSEHRRALIPYAQNPYFPQRFAIDWVRIGNDGKLFASDSSLNKNWYSYNNEVIAVADGMIVDARDSIRDNDPLSKQTITPLTLESAAGNYLILDLGDRNYAVYAHLQPETLLVKIRETVQRGQIIARVGNSGSSAYPHLHFHVGNTPAPLISQGLPYILGSFERSGVGKISSRREMEIPLENMVVNF